MIRFYHQKITIIRARKPVDENINRRLQWLGSSLGLFNLRDKDKSCFRIFIEFLKATKRRMALSSDELAYKLGLTRGTVIHHMNRLMESGLVTHEGNKYLLRVNNLSELVDEVRKDIDRTCSELKAVAEDVDKKLGL